jgi:hypothetical protein
MEPEAVVVPPRSQVGIGSANAAGANESDIANAMPNASIVFLVIEEPSLSGQFDTGICRGYAIRVKMNRA